VQLLEFLAPIRIVNHNRGFTIIGPQARGCRRLPGLRLASVRNLACPATPPYDLSKSRHELLELRCLLLEEGPTEHLYNRALRAPGRYPGLPEAVLVRAQALYLKQAFAQATDLLESALQSDPSQWPYQILLAEIHSQQNDRPAAGRDDGSTDDNIPDSAEAWYLKSFATLDARMALTWASEALSRDPAHVPALESVVRLSKLNGDLEGSSASVTKLLELKSGLNDRVRYKWARYKYRILVELRQYPAALAACDRLLALAPDSYENYILRSRIDRFMSLYSDAVRDLTTALQLRGEEKHASAWIYYHRGTPQWIVGNLQDAAADFDKAYRFLTYSTFANTRLFLVLHELGRGDEADIMLAAARRDTGEDLWLAQVLTCLSGEIAPEQLIAAGEALGHKQLCEAYYYAGEVCLLRGQVARARRYLQQCVDTGLDSDPELYLDPMSEYELARWRLGRLAAEDAGDARSR
jgi:tetratricopeptide (TPR) repeat protein